MLPTLKPFIFSPFSAAVLPFPGKTTSAMHPFSAGEKSTGQKSLWRMAEVLVEKSTLSAESVFPLYL